MLPPLKPDAVEIVLADGRFARCAPILVEHYLGFHAGGCSPSALLVMVAKVVTIDGVAYSVEDLCRMPLATYTPIAGMVSRAFSAALNAQAIA